MKKSLYFKVDGEWFTNFIRTMYYDDNISYNETKYKLIKSLCLNELSLEEQNEICKSIIYGKKKFVGSNSFDLVDDLEFDLYAARKFNKPNFEKNSNGLIGILTQEGLFVQCKYGQHSQTLSKIGERLSKGSLIFAADMSFKIFYCMKDEEKVYLSIEQKDWIKEHKEYFSKNQIKDVETIVELEEFQDEDNIKNRM